MTSYRSHVQRTNENVENLTSDQTNSQETFEAKG